MTKTDFGKSDIEKVIRALFDYVQQHLRYEEKLLKDNDYPNYEQHKSSHTQFEKKVTEFQQAFETGKDMFLVSDMGSFLIDWLIKHIKNEDQAYASHLNLKGIF